MSQADWASTLGTIFAGVSALAAAAAIYFPWRTQKSQKFLDQATLSLERAYEALSSGGQQIQPPNPDRLNWLTAARHIEQYRRLKKLIKCKEHQLICRNGDRPRFPVTVFCQSGAETRKPWSVPNSPMQGHALLHGEEHLVFADAGYQGIDKREERCSDATWHVAMRPSQRKALPDTESGRRDEWIEWMKARIRARVEHPFHIVKNRFGLRKVRYRGLAKNTAQFFSLLVIAKRRLFALQGRGAT